MIEIIQEDIGGLFSLSKIGFNKPNYRLSMKIEVYKPTWESLEFNFLPMILLQQF